MGSLRPRPTSTTWLVLVALVALPTPSKAAEPTKTEVAAARDLFARAERDEDAGRWTDALEKLKRASSVKMTPGIRFHIALCEEKLGQLVSALADYTAAEAAARSDGNKEVMDAIADPLASLRARIPTLTIVVPADTKGAEVTIDGGAVAAGLLGVPLPVDVGAHTVGAHAPGRLPFSSTVNASEKQALTVEVRWPAAAAASAPLPASTAGSTPASPPPSSAIVAAEEPRTNDSSSFRGGALATSVLAAGSAGFGVAAYFVAGSKQSTAESQCLTEPAPTCDDRKAGVRTWDALALGAWIVGGGAGALSIYLWTRPGTRAEASPKEAPGAAKAELRAGPGSLQFAGTF